MEPYALTPYEGALSDATPLHLVASNGHIVPLAIDRYLADADAVDRMVLDKVCSPVLDIGCGPGRMVQALADAGLTALGVDIAETAVRLATERGAAAVKGSVFDPLPREGQWQTALLLDGNVGIGGNPEALLSRIHAVLAPGGSLIVEVNSAGADTDEVPTMRFGTPDGPVGRSFRWSVLGRRSVIRYAEGVGFSVIGEFCAEAREFVRFSR